MKTEETPRLTEATVQEIQFELIRRHMHNACYGDEIAEDLLAHRDWWEAVLIDRQHDLIKLRDLKDNHWNVDTLYILATDERSARRLAELGRESWEADTVEIRSREATQRKLGSGYIERRRVVEMWWD